MAEHVLGNLLGETFSPFQRKLMPEDLRFRRLSLELVEDVGQFIRDCEIASSDFKVAGEDRYADWQAGWSGKGIANAGGEYDNLPYYFKNNTHIRVGKNIYKDIAGFAEVDMLRSLQAVVFSQYLSCFRAASIVEYGCGTGSNITFLKALFGNYDFYAADWAISALENVVNKSILPKKNVFHTNYFDESTFTSPVSQFVVFTNASLEQTGSRYLSFIRYLIENKLCAGGIHIEPMRELLDLSVPANRQSFTYAEQRGYLENFSGIMQSLPIEVILAQDFGIGSRFISGYQVLVWIK
jgi:hypothetical protein